MNKNKLIHATGVVLAGGRSTRMGRDKALLPVANTTAIEAVVDKLRRLFQTVLVSCRAEQDYPLLQIHYNAGVRVCHDIFRDASSLGGIHSGLVHSSSRMTFFVACDMPLLNDDLVRYMAEGMEQYDVVVPRTPVGFEPLCAFYSKQCIDPIEGQLRRGNLKILDFFPMVRLREVQEEEILQFDPEKRSFFNINTQSDYQQVLHRLADETVTLGRKR